MKKMVCVLVLTCAVLGTAFAQKSAESKNGVAWDVFPLFKGFIASDKDLIDINFSAAYERLIVPHFSIGPDVEAYFSKFYRASGIAFYFSLAAEGRYYPMANFDKFFVGTTVGFNLLSIDGRMGEEDGGFIGLLTSLKMGYKVVPTKHFYIEPSLSYVLSKTSVFSGGSGGGGLLGGILDEILGGDIGSTSSLGIPGIPTPLGWQCGLRVGFAF